jgi:oxygen-dependent protoporphyrinogen oxidase
MRRHFGDEAVTYLAEPLLAGIHAGDVDRLSVAALFPRLREAERTHGSLLRAFRRQRRAVSTDGAFRSLPGGLSELVRALEARLPPDAVRLGARVSSVDASARGGFQVRAADAPPAEARAVVVATPAYVSGAVLRGLDAELARLCTEVPYASTATVALAYPRDAVAHPLNGSGFVVPRVEGTGILAGSWLSSKWPFRAPEGKVLLRTFVGGARDPDALDSSDDELIARSIRAIRPLLGIAGDPIFTRVYRWTRASAQHEVGHLVRMAAIERRLAAHPGLFVTGSGFRGVGIPDCVADGRATARQVITWLHSHEPVRSPR